MTVEEVAAIPEFDVARSPATVSIGNLQTAFTTLIQLHDTITDLKSRCLSVAEIENANRMIRALETRLSGYKVECQRLADTLRESERRTRIYKRRSEDADAKLVALQRTISQQLSEHLIEDAIFGPVALELQPQFEPLARQAAGL